MSSRRPLLRSFSGNGRYGGYDGDVITAQGGRPDGRGYPFSMRTETRSTLCSVMAQLAVETQPSFETTLKSKAVSESCNAKFTCVVSGNPAPEVTWYKDDMEMDRYCGLPKYEIFSNGKTHTLQIYNCTQDDAAIYQASARNSKGIVSCSGLLEVGAMDEFKIHQRFFAKLKQKADSKRKDLEESRRRGRESTPPPRAASPIQRPRLVRCPSEPGPSPPPAPVPEAKPRPPEDKPVELPVERPVEQPIQQPVKQPAVFGKTPIANGVAIHQEPIKENGKPAFLYFGNKVEIITTRPAAKDAVANKAVKTSRADGDEPAGGRSGDGVLGSSSSGKEKEASEKEEEMSLAQYLTKYSKPEPSSPLQNGAPLEEVSKPGPVAVRQAAREKETSKNKGAPQQRPLLGVSVPAVRLPAETTGQKGRESPSTLASVFFSLRDMFFRNKNKSEEPAAASGATANGVDPPHRETTEGRGVPAAGQPPTRTESPQTRQRAASGKTQTAAPQPEPVKVNRVLPSVETPGKEPLLQKKQPPDPPARRFGLKGPSEGVTVRSAPSSPVRAREGRPSAPPLHPPEPLPVHPSTSVRNRSPKVPSKPQPQPAITLDHTQVNRKDQSTGRHKKETQPPTSTAGHVKAEADDTHTLHKRIHSASGTPSQFHANVLDESQKKRPVDPGTSGNSQTSGSKDAHKCPVTPAGTPGKAEPTVGGAAEKDRGVSVGAAEIHAGSLPSWDNTAPSVEEPVWRGGTEIRVNALSEKETRMQNGKAVTETVSEKKGGLPGPQGEKGTTSTSSELSMIVQVKLLEGPQPEKVRQNVPKTPGNVQKDGVTNAIHTAEPKPEVIKLQLRLPDVPHMSDRTCSKTSFLKPQAEKIIDPPTPLADNNPGIPEQSNLPKDAMVQDSALDMPKSTGKTILVTPIQQITESNKDLSQPTEPEKAAQKDQEVIPGREKAEENSSSHPSTGTATDPASLIRNSTEDNSGLSKTDTEHQHNIFQSSVMIRVLPKPPTFVVPPISITSSDDITPEINLPSKDEVKQLDSLTPLMKGVMSGPDSCVNQTAAGNKKINSAPCGVQEPTLKDSDMPLGITALEPSVKKTPSRMSESLLEKVLCTDVIVTQPDEEEQKKGPQLASDTSTNQHAKEKSGLSKNNPIGPESPLLSPTSTRRDPARDPLDMEAPGLLVVPAIRVDRASLVEKPPGEGTIGDTLPSPAPSCESSPRLRQRNNLTLIPSATPEELALGARRKIFIPKSKTEEAEALPGLTDSLAKKEEVPKRRTPPQEQEAPYTSPSQTRRPTLLQLPAEQQTPPLPRRSPLGSRKKMTLEVPKCPEETVKESDKTEPKPAEKDKLDPLKAPQVLRKIRAEPFPDNAGHLKMCCQFFNVLSDSTIKWCRDEAEIVEVNRSAGDEGQVALAIIHISSADCGVYSCSIKNEYGTDSTDFFLSAAILSEFHLRADLEVGQEIEMTPMLFTKGLADVGHWGNKFFGRIMITESRIGDGCAHKACRVKVIYGLEPAFESGSTCIIKVQNPISYEKKDQDNLVERNLEITQQECKIQNMIREYCKVFSAEARVAGNFGPVLEVIPLYLIYQPANTIPYATIEADLKGVFLKQCLMDASGRLIMRTGSEVEQMCCTFQHWIHQWTNGNLLLTQLEGVDGKITSVGVATRLKGYQGLTDKATPKVFEQFVTQHQCNSYCTLLGLRSLKAADSLTQPTKTKGSRSPMLNRRGSPSPQMLRKGGTSPQTPRKVSSSPRLTRRSSEPGDGKPAVKNKTLEVPKVLSAS